MTGDLPAPPEHFDVIVVGAGAGGMTAACVAAAEGKSVLLLEQSDRVGGTTAISGGMMWIPNNHKMKAAGVGDDPEAVLTYLSRTAPRGSEVMIASMLAHGDEAIRYLEAHTSVQARPVPTYPDYYPQQPGSRPGARVLEPVPFDARRLGTNFTRLRPPLPEFMLFGGMMISREDIPHLRRVGRSARSTFHVAKLILSYGWQRLRAPRGTTLYLGNALAGRLFCSLLDLGVDLRTEAQAEALLTNDGRVAGVAAKIAGRDHTIAADSVILATGGISRDLELREGYTPPAARSLSATIDRGNAPSGARLAKRLGAAMSAPAEGGGLWVPASTFKRSDNSDGVFPHTVTDRGKPGLIAVDCKGRRFVNEALSYHEFGLAQLRNAEDAIPAHLICDSGFLWKYGLGRIRPFSRFLATDVHSGYLRRADTICGLANMIGVPPAALEATIARYNSAAADGEDPEFGRGGDIYQRHLGDGDVRPNPCVAPILKAPFYSVEVRPADLGLAAGLVTNDRAQVLAEDGAPIPGLLACGNDMHSVMGGAYPGPGITLGPAITFGYVAAMTAAHGTA
jgi:hypothetical protein